MSVFIWRRFAPTSCVLLLTILPAGFVHGQSVVRANSFEIGPFIGASHGLDSTRVMGGANVTYAVSKYILPYFEYSYFPGIPKQTTNQGVITNYSIPISDIHAGVHVRIPVFRESRFVPYGVFGMGGLVTRDSIAASTLTNGTVVPVPAPGTNAFAVNGGGGLRYYLGQRYGMRVEAKVYKGFGDLNETFSKVEFGFFFQLR